jgi:hypothetical protein
MGKHICSVDEWFDHAPPKEGSRQWVDGRSAKELAKSFFQTGVSSPPKELTLLLSSSHALGQINLIEAWPEYKIQLDSFRGETRNADLAAIGLGLPGVIAITVEAKADESFGNTIEKTLAGIREKSNIPSRITTLAQAVLGRHPSEVSLLRYQLLHGTAASLILAQELNATAAVFVVFEFISSSCSKRNLGRNDADLNAFIHTLSPTTSSFVLGKLSGPFSVPGGGRIPSGVPLFIGKASLYLT